LGRSIFLLRRDSSGPGPPQAMSINHGDAKRFPGRLTRRRCLLACLPLWENIGPSLVSTPSRCSPPVCVQPWKSWAPDILLWYQGPSLKNLPRDLATASTVTNQHNPQPAPDSHWKNPFAPPPRQMNVVRGGNTILRPSPPSFLPHLPEIHHCRSKVTASNFFLSPF